MSTIDDDDLNEVLRLAFPQGAAVLRHEDGTELLRHGARSLIGSPSLAYEVLGATTTKALSRAVRTLSERYAAIADRLDELVAGGQSTSAKARSGASYNTDEP